jgi:DNA-binding response OmpR family regulator
MTRVLAVEDDAQVLKLVETVLRHSGYDVVPAADGRAALACLDESIDVVLCDKNLPEVPGTQVVLEARQRFANITTVLMTADPQALALTELGLDGYLAKPFRSNALIVHTVEAARERRKQAQQRQQLEGQLAATREQLQRTR